ncbi:Thiol-disulfide isomerase or thioredoxin [Paenibacillus sp. yr247]|uniref:thioredoxin family protein n=1 Tax=Paenibacillus sp. yr247 TaxID=1761880 RepID=UPI00089276EA|nr:thioredoxin family protein [Paenibacillus sp. yr247]SDN51000.1 Thiol-disulfide isomerase or thioredoxin [Paenibacillus sp. yr247]
MERILTEDRFQDLVNRDQYTVVKFDTTWCPDCKNMDRFIDEIITENKDKDFYAIDAEQFQTIVEANEVRGIPSLLVYKNGVKLGHLHSKFAKTPAQVQDYLESIS